MFRPKEEGYELVAVVFSILFIFATLFLTHGRVNSDGGLQAQEKDSSSSSNQPARTIPESSSKPVTDEAPGTTAAPTTVPTTRQVSTTTKQPTTTGVASTTTRKRFRD